MMIFLQQTNNLNLQQALQMSIYTWGIAIVLGLLVFLLARFKIKALGSEIQLFQILIIILAPYNLITGLLWFYYFTLVLCLPFFTLQLIFTFKLYRLNPSNKITHFFIGIAIFTLLLSLGAAWFFGIL